MYTHTLATTLHLLLTWLAENNDTLEGWTLHFTSFYFFLSIFPNFLKSFINAPFFLSSLLYSGEILLNLLDLSWSEKFMKLTISSLILVIDFWKLCCHPPPPQRKRGREKLSRFPSISWNNLYWCKFQAKVTSKTCKCLDHVVKIPNIYRAWQINRLRILANYKAKPAKISNLWTFWPIIQLKWAFISWITGQIVQKLQILPFFASYIASILNNANRINNRLIELCKLRSGLIWIKHLTVSRDTWLRRFSYLLYN